jgi:putative colanic acid biosynthesis acetyltransferase WcaF
LHDPDAIPHADMAPPARLDIAANRAAKKWTRGELLARAGWEVLRGPLFAWTPRPLWAWRRMVLRIFGARISAHVRVHPTVRIEIPWHLTIGEYTAVGDRALLYSLGRITLGRSVTISQNAHLCAGSHDFRDPAMRLLKPPITVGDAAWVCADAFVGPDVRIGAGAVVGARAVVMRDVADGSIVIGNPGVVVGQR